ncbi:HGxxPAAW family protein [Nocardiopsis halophila]|uniref:HGxxPAAW family protein n=1 Tax=Nocardiopsis halophila TaxID=141692 RepID=UPI0003481221|nr:HGxxPAAW family protein [Nocardiopsis halophila]
MADAHHEEHEDHGNTVAAWFLTISWIAAWTVAGAAIILGGDIITWTLVGLGASVVLAVVAGVMKKAGLGRKEPRPVPPTREQWEAGRAEAAAGEKSEEKAAKKSAKKGGEDDKEPAAAGAK